MRCSTVSTLMAAAFVGEAMAGPAHMHLHRHAHEKKDVDFKTVDYSGVDWDNVDVDWTSAYWAGQASKTAAPVAVETPTVAVASPTVAVAKAAATTAASKSSAADLVSAASIVDDVTDAISDLFDSLVGASNSRTSFGTAVAAKGGNTDAYMGNYGSPYGSNMMKVSTTSGYDFTNTFTNTASKAMTINIWNKVGPDTQPQSGPSMAPKNTSLTFVLQPGKSQIVAFQDDTQAAFAQACDDIGADGSYATTWGEIQYKKEGSGYDVSAIMNKNGNNYNMSMSSEEVECVSDMTQNFWLAAYTPIGESDGSCYVPGSTMHLTTKMGGVVS